MLVIAVLRQQRQTDPWGSLASWHSLLGKFQAGERRCLKTNKNIHGAWGVSLEVVPGPMSTCVGAVITLRRPESGFSTAHIFLLPQTISPPLPAPSRVVQGWWSDSAGKGTCCANLGIWIQPSEPMKREDEKTDSMNLSSESPTPSIPCLHTQEKVKPLNADPNNLWL